MKIKEMNFVITGANGATATKLMDYFSARAQFVTGTVRSLSGKHEKDENRAIIQMELLDHYSIDNSIAWIQKEVGDIHAWLNVAGGFTMGKHVEEGHDDWSFMYNTNFMTALNCCQQILPIMKKQGFGRIINFGSQAAVQGMPLAGPYCASKAALHMLTKITALELPNNLTCNAMLPGIIDTAANRTAMPDADHHNWVKPEQIAEKIEEVVLSELNGELIKI